MPYFSTQLHKLGNELSFTAIINIAHDYINTLPKHKQDILYGDLARGTAILDDEDHMNMYLHCYGTMHKAKMDEAIDKLPPSFKRLFSEDIEIYDWGCGQGVATICLLDMLRNKHQQPNIKRINLIDPSVEAVKRAKDILSCYQEGDNYEIRIVTKVFDDLQPDDINCYGCRKLHLFSNILDVAKFDMPAFTQLFQKTQKGGNYIISVGPLNPDYKRADWFLEALNVNPRYVTLDKPKGCWEKDWTISLRIAGVKIDTVDEITNIKKRISEAQKYKQFYAGYITDALSEIIDNSGFSKEANELMVSVSTFDVISNKTLEHEGELTPILAVLSNIISRGLPTKAPLLIEKLFADKFHFSCESDKYSPELYFRKTDVCSAEEVFEALHLIDPRFDLKNYNEKILESSFESDFIKKYLPKDDKEYLAQVLEPQRSLSSLVDLPNRMFTREQRVDFALEMPYSTQHQNSPIGFVVEINGEQYHSSTVSRIKDARRNRMIRNNGWDTDSLTSIHDESFISDWEQDEKYSSYLGILKKNFKKDIKGHWADCMQFVLSPFAVARIEKILIEAMITGSLDLNAKTWNIAIIERDVPCAKIAIEDITEWYNHLCKLNGTSEQLPNINLTIISSAEFYNSPLHGDLTPLVQQKCNATYDICIDISMLVRGKIDARTINVKSETYYIIRSSHHLQGVRTIYSADNIEYMPLVNKTTRGEYITIPEREDVITYFLQNIFRKKKFREGQLPIISKALTNKTTIGLLPTGGGKSLIYQLAAILQPGVTIIIDPLIALMVDQYEGLTKQRIDSSAYVNSNQTREIKSFNIGRLENGELQFMFLSPERFMMEDFRNELLNMARRNKVYFAYGVIDEVHCVSEWGHDFRPAYLQLGRNMTQFMETSIGKAVSIIGLTATASFDVLADVERELTLGGQMSLDSDAIVRPEISEREELTYRIIEVKTDFLQCRSPQAPSIVKLDNFGMRSYTTRTKRIELEHLLQQVPHDLEIINNSQKNSTLHIADYSPSTFYNSNREGLYENAGIIFCPVREGERGVYDRVTQWNIKLGISTFVRGLSPDYSVATFVGGDNPNGLMEAFKKNRHNIMVATKAFGMGIDKPNVRFSINLTHSSSIESYVQEAGRAGRDKKVSISYLLFESTEYIELSVENVTDALGKNHPYTWLNLNQYKDKFVLTTDFKQMCKDNNLTEAQTLQLENAFAPFKQNIDKEQQIFFHNNSFRGAVKEKIILGDLYSDIFNALQPLKEQDADFIIVPWKNIYAQNPQIYLNDIETAANNVANMCNWATLWPNAINLRYVNTFDDLLKEISNITGDDHWRKYHKDNRLWELKKVFCKKRDKDDTDKAIYRMCCIGLVDDVTTDYINEFYTLKVVKKPEGVYYDTLRCFFEKYYSAEQATRKVEEAKRHKGNTEIEKCLGYITDFVYENLEVKRRRAIEDMQEACIDGIRNGDEWLKDFIHLYFNSKYARDKYEIDGVNYSLKQDIKNNPSITLILKYIRVMNNDTSGTSMDNVKHLYGAVLIILRAQAKDDTANTILFLLRSYCLAYLGVGNNSTLIEEFKEGYYTEGFEKVIKNNVKHSSIAVLRLIDIYNDVVSKSNDKIIVDYVNTKKSEIKLQLTNKSIDSFTKLYTN